MRVDLSGTSAMDVPLALRSLYRRLSAAEVTETPVRVVFPPGIDPVRAADLSHLCGFELEGGAGAVGPGGECELSWFETAPSTLGSAMRLLIVGVNPSPTSAVSGIPFARNGNRFWPAMLDAGIANVDRDPEALLASAAVGMTDLSKMVTRRADEVPGEVLVAGLQRLERVVAWLQPGAVAVVGIMAWRTAMKGAAAKGTATPKPVLGRQPEDFGGAPLWILPNPSGLNAHTSVADMSERLQQVMRSVSSAP
jgi:TDG/mug DNA glycosylase family protein